MGFLCGFHGISMWFPWDSYECSMGFCMGFLRDLYGISIVSLWDVYDMSKGLVED